jgi:hypothetical protein
MGKRPWLFAFVLFVASVTSVPAQWRVEAKPRVEIGAEGQGDEYTFSQILSVARLSDGRILVVDPGTTSVRLFDSTGKFVVQIGGKGSGPGEYRMPFWGAVGRGDTIYVYDYNEGPGKLLQFLANGRFVRSALINTRNEAAAAVPIALLPDGSVLLKGSVSASYPMAKPRPYRGLSGIVRFHFPETVANVLQIPGQFIEAGRRLYRNEGVAGATDSLLYVGDGETGTISVYDVRGKAVRSRDVKMARRQFTERDQDAHIASMRARANARPSDKEMIERQIAQTTYPDAFPPYIAWITDVRGNLWVGSPRNYFDPAAAYEYAVFDPQLNRLATVSLPPNFHPRLIGDTFILGVGMNADDVPTVQLRRLMK